MGGCLGPDDWKWNSWSTEKGMSGLVVLVSTCRLHSFLRRLEGSLLVSRRQDNWYLLYSFLFRQGLLLVQLSNLEFDLQRLSIR